MAKAVLSVCTVHRQRWILYWRPIFNWALTVLCGVGAFFRTYVANRNRPHYLRNFAARKMHFFQIFPNDLSGTPRQPHCWHERQDSDHFGKNLEKNGKLFQNIFWDFRRRTPIENATPIMKFFGKFLEKDWQKFSKTFSKIFWPRGLNHTKGNYEFFAPGHNFFGKNDVLLRNTIYVIYVTYFVHRISSTPSIRKLRRIFYLT